MGDVWRRSVLLYVRYYVYVVLYFVFVCIVLRVIEGVFVCGEMNL